MGAIKAICLLILGESRSFIFLPPTFFTCVDLQISSDVTACERLLIHLPLFLFHSSHYPSSPPLPVFIDCRPALQPPNISQDGSVFPSCCQLPIFLGFLQLALRGVGVPALCFNIGSFDVTCHWKSLFQLPTRALIIRPILDFFFFPAGGVMTISWFLVPGSISKLQPLPGEKFLMSKQWAGRQ